MKNCSERIRLESRKAVRRLLQNPVEKSQGPEIRQFDLGYHLTWVAAANPFAFKCFWLMSPR